MATRIEIELTSRQNDGNTFTWRAAGAREPKGIADAGLFPSGAEVGEQFRVEADMDLEGITITSVLPPKDEKKSNSPFQTLDLIARDDEPLVTQQLAEKSRGRDRDRKGGKGRGRDGDRGKGRGRDGDRKGGKGGDRPRTPPKPKLPPKPKPPRLKAGKAHRNALLAELPEEHKAVAEQLVRGGLQGVRQALAKQNEERTAAGDSPIDETPIVSLAEELLGRVRAAEWRDRAEAALEQAETVDLRDLRSVVTASEGTAKDDETRALAAKLRTALNERLDADQQAWVNEVIELLDDDRVVRALHLSSRPPKAGAPLPAPVAMRLVEAANASMTSDVSPDRWTYILDALAHSPVRRQVVPASLPPNVTPELKTVIARHGARLPEIAEIFGVEPDAKAGRGERKRRPKKKVAKKKAPAPKDAESKDTESKDTESKDAPSGDAAAMAPEADSAAPSEAAAPEADAAPATEEPSNAPSNDAAEADAAPATDEPAAADSPTEAAAETPGDADADDAAASDPA